MPKKLEEEINEEPIEYDISDIFIPFKALRNLPKIRRINDPLVRGYEIILNAATIAVQLQMYYELYTMFTKK